MFGVQCPLHIPKPTEGGIMPVALSIPPPILNRGRILCQSAVKPSALEKVRSRAKTMMINARINKVPIGSSFFL